MHADDRTSSVVVPHMYMRDNLKEIVNAPKGMHDDYEDRFVKGLRSTRKSTLDRGMRVNNRSRKHAKQWRTSAQERSVLRYTTGG